MKKQYTLFILVLLILISNISQKGVLMASTNQIQLPEPDKKGKITLEEAIAKRRSKRTFRNQELSLEQIGQLLWAAQGITAKRGGFSFRAAPSAGALYPMEIYLLTQKGTFHYLPPEHKLEVLGEKDLRRGLADAALGQDVISQAPLDIVICAVYYRVTSKYGQRGRRYVDIEAGHIAQNIHLQAVALGLASVPIGAFDDQSIQSLLALSEDCEPLYIIPVGYSD